MRFLFLFLICFSFRISVAQESVTQETNATYIKWYQINTPNFRILYPRGYDDQAQRVANTLETIREPEARTMGKPPKKISIILQNQSSVSNGFVTMAPRRSEFFTMPSQNYNFVGNNDWLNLLSSHEYRHMVQFQRGITGFNKFVSVAFGQQFTAALMFAAAPQWFWEGDAVAAETAFTPGGRGRVPQFDLLFKTNIMEGRTFNYHKQYLRSYKHNIPNHYVLGYNMISYLRKKTNDPMIWEKVAGKSWSVPFIPFAFSNSMKKYTGLHLQEFYLEMAAARKKEYEDVIAGLELTPFEPITQRQGKAYTDYLYPQPLDNGNLVAVKSGIGDIEQLVLLSPEGKELESYAQGFVNDAGMLSATNQRVVWNEFRFDPRWKVHTYSIIKGYDFGSHQLKVVSKESRYAAAALSPDGYKVATIESSNDYQTRLVVIDYFSGNVIQSFDNPGNDMISMPRWADNNTIVALRIERDGKAISKFDVSNGSRIDLLQTSQENIGSPVPFQDFILFNSPASGIDNIYAIHTKSGERFQVTNHKYGAYNPAVSKDERTLFFNSQTKDGMDVVRMPLNPTQWKRMDGVPQPAQPTFQHLVDQEAQPDLLKQVSETKFESRRYHRASGMINPHSWGPYLVNSLTRVNLGITSQDILSTTAIHAGYTYDVNERTGYWQAGASYQGFFPIIDFNYYNATRSANEGDYEFLRVDTVQTAPLALDSSLNYRNIKFSWKEQTIEAGLRVPLITTSSKYIGNFSFSNYVGFTQITGFSNSINTGRFIPYVERSGPSTSPTPMPFERGYFFNSYQDNGSLYYNHFAISTYRLLKQSRRDINSKWGQALDIDFYSTPYGGDFSGSQFSLTGTMYFPGLFKHHSFWGYWAYQHANVERYYADPSNYTFRNQVPLPRGQTVSLFQNFYSMSANYTLPIWYPDAAIGPLLNIQRLRTNFFVDYGYGNSAFPEATAGNYIYSAFNVAQTYTSIGTEVKFDINVMRFLPQFNVGFRYSYGLTPSVTKFEVLIGSFNF